MRMGCRRESNGRPWRSGWFALTWFALTRRLGAVRATARKRAPCEVVHEVRLGEIGWDLVVWVAMCRAAHCRLSGVESGEWEVMGLRCAARHIGGGFGFR